MTSLYDCQNLQEFLDLFRGTGVSKRKISFAALSSKLKYSSDRTLGMIYKGQRLPSYEMQRRMSKYLKLAPKEIFYLSALIQKERCKRKGQAFSEVDEQLRSLRPVKSEYLLLSDLDVHHMTQWYYFPVKNIIFSSSEGVTLSEVCEQLEGNVPKQNVVEALQVLNNVKIIEKKDDRFFALLSPNKYLHSKVDVPSKSLREAHRKMLSRATEALEEQSVLDREFLTKSLIVPFDKIDKAKQRIREVCEELSDELISENSLSPRAVYQLSVQFFRQAKPKPLKK